MTSTATTPCPDSVPARAGTLGIGAPPALSVGFMLAELERRTGDELELQSSGEGYVLFNWTVGDALAEGSTRAECLANAFEAV